MALLRDRAFLSIDAFGTTATFEFGDGASMTRSGQRSYLVAQRGQFISGAWDVVADATPLPESGADRRTGYHADGGAGEISRVLEFATGAEESDSIQWGDSSGSLGPDGVTQTDASGPGVNKEDRADVLENWAAAARIDSTSAARLHYNQWSDGSFGDEGVFGEPMKVVVDKWTINAGDTPSAISGTITMTRTAVTPVDLTGEARKILETDIADW